VLIDETKKVAARAATQDSRRTLIVPRLVRCDATYELIEGFFDQWTLAAGTAVIDPLPAALPGQRIRPLPVPCSYRDRLARTAMFIGGGGVVALDPRGVGETRGWSAVDSPINAADTPLAQIWQRLLARRRSAHLLDAGDIQLN
jgi:hypothetical protein